MINGIVNVYKEAGYTSFDVVAKLRGILGQRKIGHTGTLDPDATGVLPVVLGSATKLVDMLTDKRKEYVANFELGKVTDTQDISGTVVSEQACTATDAEVRSTIEKFVGDIMQIPPMYSALKVDGKKLCDLAREGKVVERKPRPVTIYDIEILELNIPNVRIRVECSKGTYIRTLCHDIGEMLGCGAVMTKLERTRSGDFYIDTSLTLSQIEKARDNGTLESAIIPVDALFTEYAKACPKGEELKRVLNGNGVYINKMNKYISDTGVRKCIRVYDENDCFLALYERDDKKHIYRVKQMFGSN